MCPAFDAALSSPLAIMPSADQPPTNGTHSRCWALMGSSDPAVSTGFRAVAPLALSNPKALPFSSAVSTCCDSHRLSIALAAHHHGPDDPGCFIRQRRRCDLGRAPLEQSREPSTTRALHRSAD